MVNIYLTQDGKPSEELNYVLDYLGLSLEEFLKMTDQQIIFLIKKFTDALGENKSRYFDIEVWSEKYGLLQYPKASKSERNAGCDGLEDKEWKLNHLNGGDKLGLQGSVEGVSKNNHPTVKPLHLVSWLVKLISKEGDVVLDPFLGSGTTLMACKMLSRKGIGIEKEKDYCEIAVKRIDSIPNKLF